MDITINLMFILKIYFYLRISFGNIWHVIIIDKVYFTFIVQDIIFLFYKIYNLFSFVVVLFTRLHRIYQFKLKVLRYIK